MIVIDEGHPKVQVITFQPSSFGYILECRVLLVVQQEDATVADGEPAGTAAAVDENELIKLHSERSDLYNKLARAQAEFQNARKRLEADKEQAVQYANSALINMRQKYPARRIVRVRCKIIAFLQ